MAEIQKTMEGLYLRVWRSLGELQKAENGELLAQVVPAWLVRKLGWKKDGAETLANLILARANAVKDTEEDSQENRAKMLDILRSVRAVVEDYKTRQDAYLVWFTATEPVRAAIVELDMAVAGWVERELMRGHTGAQEALVAAFSKRIGAAKKRAGNVLVGEVPAFVSELEKLTEEVRNFVQNWCKWCGTPIPFEIALPGQKPFRIDSCTACHKVHQPAKVEDIKDHAYHGAAHKPRKNPVTPKHTSAATEALEHLASEARFGDAAWEKEAKAIVQLHNLRRYIEGDMATKAQIRDRVARRMAEYELAHPAPKYTAPAAPAPEAPVQDKPQQKGKKPQDKVQGK